MSEPTFTVQKKLISKAYYVMARWPDGRKVKVGRFPNKTDAERWVQYKSKSWLQEKLAQKPAA